MSMVVSCCLYFANKQSLLWWVDSCIEFTLIFFTSVRPLFFPSNLSCYLGWSRASLSCFSSCFSLGRLGFRAGYGITTVFDQSLVIWLVILTFFHFHPGTSRGFMLPQFKTCRAKCVETQEPHLVILPSFHLGGLLVIRFPLRSFEKYLVANLVVIVTIVKKVE